MVIFGGFGRERGVGYEEQSLVEGDRCRFTSIIYKRDVFSWLKAVVYL